MHSPQSQVSTEIIRAKPDPKRPQIERRGRERLKCKRRPIVRLIGSDARAFRAIIRDATRQGLGLLTESSLELGATLTIELQSARAGFSGVLTAQVRHATQLPDGSWLIGCSLARELSAFELFSLV